ncbi:hypothetical protein [Pedobacter sp. UBA5917]|jgi:hypothetical protein|uniref:hypothetical protein n=1 Tax=Pedobacter sp. UBA5917 TaxID=1947061 RepID=UPI0025EEBF62|nr:hypothetical protein [Pedobacter sp. UBA5917]
MKTKLTTMAILLICFSFAGCKKDEVTDNGDTTVARLQGKWEATRSTERVYEKDSNKLVSEETSSYPANSRTIEYKDKNILYYRGGALRNTYAYAIIGSEIRLREGNNGVYYQLKFYSDTQHSHTEESFYTTNNVKMKSTFETVYIKK